MTPLLSENPGEFTLFGRKIPAITLNVRLWAVREIKELLPDGDRNVKLEHFTEADKLVVHIIGLESCYRARAYFAVSFSASDFILTCTDQVVSMNATPLDSRLVEHVEALP